VLPRLGYVRVQALDTFRPQEPPEGRLKHLGFVSVLVGARPSGELEGLRRHPFLLCPRLIVFVWDSWSPCTRVLYIDTKAGNVLVGEQNPFEANCDLVAVTRRIFHPLPGYGRLLCLRA
jgi:hypothetical protein